MKVSEIMVNDPPVVTREDTITTAARLIEGLQSTLVPVVDSPEGRHIVGVLTGRDIMRCAASGKNPADCSVQEYMGTGYETVNARADVETALAEIPEGAGAPSGDTGSGAATGWNEGLMGRRPVVVVDDERRVVGLVTRPHLAVDMAKLQSGQVVSGRTESMNLVWRCTDCGYLLRRAEDLPPVCPDCGTSKENFVLVTED